jgi:hypothetical protein
MLWDQGPGLRYPGTLVPGIPSKEKSTRLTYTGLLGKLEHLKIKTRLTDEMFVNVMGKYVFFYFYYESRK